MAERLILGTRGSQLALAQSSQVARWIEAASGGAVQVELRVISTKGDRVQDRPLPEVGGKGLFTAELEAELHSGGIDFAVHSLKDLPTEMPEGLTLGAHPEREDPRDLLVGGPLSALPAGAVVGTGSARRRVQLLAARPDLVVEGIRGNVDTRLRKLREGPYDALVLAAAGVRRLGLQLEDAAPLDPELCVPAPGQGALGVQCRDGDARVLGLLGLIDHPPTRLRVDAERAFLNTLEGGCSVPAGALAELDGDRLRLRGVLADEQGRVHRDERVGLASEGPALGRRLALALRAALA
ncbi:MAG: hydroxymethylbilane synthase [Alphaproteobacteria bacterium]|nr:hydroxymethylbilane synthase [Alphaproteobacteria bacterium]MCB9793512.1 hydroxymethylbilane synthase [Alphaproteobacteria bacterium]